MPILLRRTCRAGGGNVLERLLATVEHFLDLRLVLLRRVLPKKAGLVALRALLLLRIRVADMTKWALSLTKDSVSQIFEINSLRKCLLTGYKPHYCELKGRLRAEVRIVDGRLLAHVALLHAATAGHLVAAGLLQEGEATLRALAHHDLVQLLLELA